MTIEQWRRLLKWARSKKQPFDAMQATKEQKLRKDMSEDYSQGELKEYYQNQMRRKIS